MSLCNISYQVIMKRNFCNCFLQQKILCSSCDTYQYLLPWCSCLISLEIPVYLDVTALQFVWFYYRPTSKNAGSQEIPDSQFSLYDSENRNKWWLYLLLIPLIMEFNLDWVLHTKYIGHGTNGTDMINVNMVVK